MIKDRDFLEIKHWGQTPVKNDLEEIVKYLQSLEKESKKSKPKTVKIPKLKKVSGSDSYKITPL